MSQLEQQMRHRDREMVPKFLIQGIFALMIGTTAMVGYAQWSEVPNRGVLVEASVVQSVDIIMMGDRGGRYTITDLDGTVLATTEDDKAGFIGVMGKVVDRKRTLQGVAADVPLQVVRRENGNIAIVDDATGLSTELIGYGVDNVAAFARLLD